MRPSTCSSGGAHSTRSVMPARTVIALAPAHEHRHAHDELLAVAFIDAQRDGGWPARRVQHHIAGRGAILDLEPAACKAGEDLIGRSRLRLLGLVLGRERW